MSESISQTFELTKLGEQTYPKQGLSSADNNRFLRFWYEIDFQNFCRNCTSNEESKRISAKWYPFNKGGEYRKWYGNFDYVINWKHDGYELRNFPNAAIRNSEYYFMPHITWSKVSSGTISFRYRPEGSVFSDAGCATIIQGPNIWYTLGLLNTKYAQQVFDLINPTINYTQSTIASLPIVFNHENIVREVVSGCFSLSRTDWDAYETSWDFKRNPLV